MHGFHISTAGKLLVQWHVPAGGMVALGHAGEKGWELGKHAACSGQSFQRGKRRVFSGGLVAPPARGDRPGGGGLGGSRGPADLSCRERVAGQRLAAAWAGSVYFRVRHLVRR